MDRAPQSEVKANVREMLERMSPDDPLLDTDGGKQDLIGRVFYILEGCGYSVMRSEDATAAINLNLALKNFTD